MLQEAPPQQRAAEERGGPSRHGLGGQAAAMGAPVGGHRRVIGPVIDRRSSGRARHRPDRPEVGEQGGQVANSRPTRARLKSLPRIAS